MSITSAVALNAQLYVPFATRMRAGPDGDQPVGTLSATGSDTGDGSGGTVTMTFHMPRSPFGFRAIVVPLYLQTEDSGTGVPKVHSVRLVQTGNRRLTDAVSESIAAVDNGTKLRALFDVRGVLIEGPDEVSRTVIEFQWETNTNAVAYQGQVYCVVYDAEVLHRRGQISELLAGVR